MLTDLFSYLQQQPVLAFFLTLGLGYLIGKIRLMSISLGPVGGVLVAGLIFGHFGFTMYSEGQTFGFVLFIFCVGYQAGPQFIDVLLSDGLKYLSLALVVAATGFVLALSCAKLLGLAPGLAAGILGGAMTTTPTLAAAQEAVQSGLYRIPAGITEQQVLKNIGAGYALTYLFGLVGLIFIIRLLPRVLRIDLPSEAAKLGMNGDPIQGADLSGISKRIYRITRDTHLGTNVRELQLQAPGQISVAGIRRNGKIIPIEADTHFVLGDIVMLIGRLNFLLKYIPEFGEEIIDEEGLRIPFCTAQIVVQNKKVVGIPIRDIHTNKHFGALTLSVARNRKTLTLSDSMVLTRGDVITVYGPESSINLIAEHIGQVELDVAETDLFTFALAIAAGIALGTLAVQIGGITITLGMAGGLLITGLTVGFLRSVWPVFGRVPTASRWVLMELGLLMFMAGVGVNSGSSIVQVIREAGLQLLGVGILVTSLPVFVGYFFGRKILGLNPAAVLGGVTGSMTSGAALSIVTEAAKSDAPSLSYTGAYAFANVILTLAGTLIMLV